jgi:hypothetical protein
MDMRGEVEAWLEGYEGRSQGMARSRGMVRRLRGEKSRHG